MNFSTKITLISSGILSIIAPAIGLIVTTSGMMGAFSTLKSSGVADPQQLSESVSTTLIYTVCGFSIGVISFIVFLITLILWFSTRPNPGDKAAEQGAAANP